MIISLENMFKVNERLEIKLSKKNNDPTYTSRIEEITSDHMLIAMPMSKGRPVSHIKGNVFYGNLCNTSGFYDFKSIFLDRAMQPLPVWIVSKPFDIVNNQQRSFVRFDVTLPVLVERIEDSETDATTPLKFITKNLSGGGVQIICNEKIETGKKIQLAMEFPEYGLVRMNGKVVRIMQPQEGRQLYWIGVEFSGISENVRDKISKFIFKKQLEQRQKGL